MVQHFCFIFDIFLFIFRPRHGGKYCVGRRMKFRSCNSEPCSKQKRDFREEQCASFDGRHFNINGLPPNVRWVPKYSGSEWFTAEQLKFTRPGCQMQQNESHNNYVLYCAFYITYSHYFSVCRAWPRPDYINLSYLIIGIKLRQKILGGSPENRFHKSSFLFLSVYF